MSNIKILIPSTELKAVKFLVMYAFAVKLRMISKTRMLKFVLQIFAWVRGFQLYLFLDSQSLLDKLNFICKLCVKQRTFNA